MHEQNEEQFQKNVTNIVHDMNIRSWESGEISVHKYQKNGQLTLLEKHRFHLLPSRLHLFSNTALNWLLHLSQQHGLTVEVFGYWTGLPPVQTCQQLKTLSSSWNKNHNKINCWAAETRIKQYSGKYKPVPFYPFVRLVAPIKFRMTSFDLIKMVHFHTMRCVLYVIVSLQYNPDLFNWLICKSSH